MSGAVGFCRANWRVRLSVGKVSHAVWQIEIQRYADEKKDYKICGLARLVLNSATAISYAKPEFDMQQTLAGLADSAIHCPTVDKKLVSTWLNYFQPGESIKHHYLNKSNNKNAVQYNFVHLHRKK